MISEEGFEFAACPLGHSEKSQIVLAGRDYINAQPGEFYIHRCPACGIEWTNPRPSPPAMGRYYPDDYLPYSSSVADSAQKTSALRARLGLYNVRRIPNLAPGKLLELGCSNGAFLEVMRKQSWVVHGIEFSEKIAALARAKGLQVDSGSAETLLESVSGPFDLIVGWMVIEHLHDPLHVLNQLRKKISSEGRIVVSVPDVSCIDAKLFGRYWYARHLPNHLYHFTPRTLSLLLERAGWKVERVLWHASSTNLLMSCSFLLRDCAMPVMARWFEDMARGRRWPRLGVALGIALGLLHQSGRVTIWAKPS